jgi:BirA family biotin operon repressor/biotin-[acetyl-CoA-carboxylase] ligase
MAFALGPKATAAGYRLDARETVGSTNAEALALARAGDPGRLWVVSDYQSAGRGRRNSAWQTPRGNLAATILSIVSVPPVTGATLGFVAGLCLDEALRSTAGLAPDRLRLKWPNDVLLDGRKLAGILLEAEIREGGDVAVAVGIGVNVVGAPSGLPYPATSLADIGAPLDAAGLFLPLAEAWAGIARLWDEGRGFAAIRRLWLERAAGIGAPVSVRVGNAVLSGAFETIDGDGRLVIRAADGAEHTISAGEVHLGMAATAR